MRIRDIVLHALNENEDYVHVSPKVIGDVIDVFFSQKDNYVRIDFSTTYGKNLSLAAKFTDFTKWANENAAKHKSIFMGFLKDFVSNSKEVQDMNEIVDDDGNIMGDDDKPNNATNSMVGSSVFDLEKIYRTSIPKSVRFYSGDSGIGSISW